MEKVPFKDHVYYIQVKKKSITNGLKTIVDLVGWGLKSTDCLYSCSERKQNIFTVYKCLFNCF